MQPLIPLLANLNTYDTLLARKRAMTDLKQTNFR